MQSDENDEEFLESQKITLRDAWAVFKTRGVNHT